MLVNLERGKNDIFKSDLLGVYLVFSTFFSYHTFNFETTMILQIM